MRPYLRPRQLLNRRRRHFVIVSFNATQVTECGSVSRSTFLVGLPNANSLVAAIIERTSYFLGDSQKCFNCGDDMFG